MSKMEREKLLSTKRVRITDTPSEPFRNDFEKDYERVVSSSSLRRLQDKCVMYAYQNSEVLSLEIIAKNVLETLLEKFINATMNENLEDKGTKSGKIYSKISSNFLLIQKFNKNGRYIKNKKIGTYEQIQTVIDYISGMTDSYALNLHKTLLGTKLP